MNASDSSVKPVLAAAKMKTKEGVGGCMKKLDAVALPVPLGVGGVVPVPLGVGVPAGETNPRRRELRETSTR